jgi:dihydrofolate reductase
MRYSIIAAVADNGVIGRDGGLPWRLPADLKHFKRLTLGHHLIIGRRTWDELGAPLPGRIMVVISRQSDLALKNAVVVRSLDDALTAARADDEPFVGGGAEIYRQAIPAASVMYLTRVHAEVEGDTVFPEVDWSPWRLVESERHEADEKHAHAMTFERWVRR